jgi:hypothetical protein
MLSERNQLFRDFIVDCTDNIVRRREFNTYRDIVITIDDHTKVVHLFRLSKKLVSTMLIYAYSNTEWNWTLEYCLIAGSHGIQDWSQERIVELHLLSLNRTGSSSPYAHREVEVIMNELDQGIKRTLKQLKKWQQQSLQNPTELYETVVSWTEQRLRVPEVRGRCVAMALFELGLMR